MEKSEQAILQFRTWNKKILLFDHYQKLVRNFPVAVEFALLQAENFQDDKKIVVYEDRLEVEKLWLMNADKEKRGIDLPGVKGEIGGENLMIISGGYLYFDENKLSGVLPVYLSRVLLEWLPFKSEVKGGMEEAILIDDLGGIQSVYSLGGQKLGNSRLWAVNLRKYLLEKAENLGNLR
jgi:hypothetical protein